MIKERVIVRFFMPSKRLAPYFSTYYLTEAVLPEGEVIRDLLHPEWSNLRFSKNDSWQAAIGDEAIVQAPHFIATGPTSRAAQFVTGSMRAWGIGLLPQGWARLIDANAEQFADRLVDGASDPAFAAFAPLLDELFAGNPDPAAEAARIDEFLLDMLSRRAPPEDERRLHAAHTALVDCDVSSVAELAERLGMSSRSLERLSLRAFGFSPKLLLRRQRFSRSLAQFMLDPSLKWISTLDWHYVDQAHFVRDFRRFMGMSPSSYAALDHPVLRAAASARTAAAGAAVQALHQP